MPHGFPDLDLRVVGEGTLVRLRYAVFDSDEDLIESGEVTYRQGQGNLRPAIEAALTGVPQDTTVEVRLTPEHESGRREPGLVLTSPAENLGDRYRRVGTTVLGLTHDGRLSDFVGRVDSVAGTHALAGAALRVVLRVTEIHPTRAAARQSLAKALRRRRRPKMPATRRLA